MQNFKRLKGFCLEFKDMEEKVFLARFAEPFLVVNMSMTGEKKFTPQNERTLKSTIKGTFEEDSSQMVTFVIPLQKEAGGDPGEGIKVGRSPKNDIVLPHPSISRTHALFLEDVKQRTYKVIDIGSSYGTELDGRPLTKNEAQPVKCGSVILMGQSAHCTFFTPDEFYRY
ncbi:MAG: FHA domain-containing protein, partial [Planctomycetota bacterium]